MIWSRDYNKEDKNIFQVGCDTVKPGFRIRLNFKPTVKYKLNWMDH
jgi:hypothetical protein